MGQLAAIEIERDVVDAAAKRAAEEGLTVEAYITMLLRRSLERDAGEESVLVYDHMPGGEGFPIDRAADETDEAYNRRTVLYDDLFRSKKVQRLNSNTSS
jgi:hypothetical protein